MVICSLHCAFNLAGVELTLLGSMVRLTRVMVTRVALTLLLAYCFCPGNPGIAANHEVEALPLLHAYGPRKPHMQASQETLIRYVRSTLQEAGVDTNTFTPYS